MPWRPAAARSPRRRELVLLHRLASTLRGEGAAQYDAAQGFSGRCRNARHDARHARLSARRYERAACLLDLLALNRAARGSELTVAVNGEVFLQRVAQVEGDVDGHVCGEGLAESVELVEA